jgi:putative oxidoreductase
MRQLQNLATLAGRLMLAAIFVLEGEIKIADYAGTLGYMEAYGVPGALLPLVILTELGGGLLVAAGFFARPAALALAGFCLLTALFFHRDIGTTEQFIQFFKNLAIAGGFLMLAAFGPGGWSLDARRRGGNAGEIREEADGAGPRRGGTDIMAMRNTRGHA